MLCETTSICLGDSEEDKVSASFSGEGQYHLGERELVLAV